MIHSPRAPRKTAESCPGHTNPGAHNCEDLVIGHIASEKHRIENRGSIRHQTDAFLGQLSHEFQVSTASSKIWQHFSCLRKQMTSPLPEKHAKVARIQREQGLI